MMFRLITLLGVATTCATCFPQADSAQPNRVAVEQQAMEQRLIHHVDPVYPPLAKQAHIQGTVVFRIVVDKDGAVKNLMMVSGHPLLVPAAQEAVRQWRYEPFLVDGKPVDVQSVVKVRVPPAPPPSSGVEQFRENARLHPDDAEAHYRLGVALLEGTTDQNADAIAELREALRLRPNHAETHTRLAEALERKHKVDQAIQEYREAIRLNSDAPEPHSKLANLLGQVDYDSAVAEYRELVRLKPEDKQAYQRLGMAFYRRGPAERATAEFREVLSKRTDAAELHGALGFEIKGGDGGSIGRSPNIVRSYG
jgi:TonB family protein